MPRSRNHADHRARRRHPSWLVPVGAAAHQGWQHRGVRRWSSNSCAPSQRPSRPSAQRHDAAARIERNAGRFDRSPPRTQTTTDPGLRYEPRRPQPIQMYSQTPNNAAVAALTSADTPKPRQPRSTAAVLAVSESDRTQLRDDGRAHVPPRPKGIAVQPATPLSSLQPSLDKYFVEEREQLAPVA